MKGDLFDSGESALVSAAIARCAALAKMKSPEAESGFRNLLPFDALPLAGAAVQAVAVANVSTPHEFARVLDAAGVRCYTHSLWLNLSAAIDVEEPSPDWESLYAEVDRPIRLKKWTKDHAEDLFQIASLVKLVLSRSGLTCDEKAAVHQVAANVVELAESGELPADYWEINLRLEGRTTFSDGSLNYRVVIGSEQLRLECSGHERDSGVGTDNWQGAEFIFEPLSEARTTGDLFEFSGDWEEAISTEGFRLHLEFNGEAICNLPQEETLEIGAKAIVGRLIRETVKDLQGITEHLSGGDSVLENAWDEICVQRQVEESYGWDVYEETMRVVIRGNVEGLDKESLLELWNHVLEEECRWDDQEGGFAPDVGDISEWLYREVLEVAEFYRNPRIIEYVDRPRD